MSNGGANANSGKKEKDKKPELTAPQAIDITAGSVSEDIIEKAIKGEMQSSLLSLIIGLMVVGCGVTVLLLGITGSISWNISFLGLSSNLSNASPGVVLIIAGYLLAKSGKPNIKIGK